MEGYFDIHAHILPGVDDGARNMEETVRMLEAAYEDGVRHIVATPHFAAGNKNTPPAVLHELLKEVQEKALRRTPELKVYGGSEILHRPGTLEALEKGDVLTLAGSRYILVEFMPDEEYRTIHEALHQYILAGYFPVVAHVERYRTLEKEYGKMNELNEMGCCLQMNVSSLAGGIFQRKAAYHRGLVFDGYIKLLGSDCHGSMQRPPGMHKELQRLGEEYLESREGKRLLFDNPKALLFGEYI